HGRRQELGRRLRQTGFRRRLDEYRPQRYHVLRCSLRPFRPEARFYLLHRYRPVRQRRWWRQLAERNPDGTGRLVRQYLLDGVRSRGERARLGSHDEHPRPAASQDVEKLGLEV